MQDTLAKKLFAVGSAAAMLASLAVPFAAKAVAHGAGTNISTPDGTVWMITANGTRRAYTSAGAFLTYGFNSWSTVVPANSDDLALPVDPAGFIPPQDGKIFCATVSKGSDVKGECSLITGGQKAAFTSAAVFTGLGFSFSRAQYGDSSFLNKTSNIDNTTAAHRPGVLVNNNGTVQLVGVSGLLGIPDLATFNSWGYSFADVVPANMADKSMVQNGVMAMRMAGQLSPTAIAQGPTPTSGGNPTPTVVVSGPISAMLAYDNPPAGTVIQGQATADLAHFTFSGNGSLSQVTLQRIGVSPNSALDNVYLYQGAHRLTDGASINTNGQISFNNVNIAVNGSVTLSVRADVDSSNTNAPSGNTIGVSLVSYTPSGNSATTANLSGNLFSIASGSGVIGTANFTGTITANPAANATVNAGSTGYTFWSDTMNVGTHSLWLKSANFQVIGSAPSDALTNITFYVNGSPAGSPTTVMNGYAFFDFSSNPVSLPTGSSNLEVRADVQKGSSRNVQFVLQNAADLMLTDSQLSNVNVSPTVSGSTFSSLSASQVGINTGNLSVTIDPSFQSLTTATGGGTNQVIGRFKLHAYGEDIKLSTLIVKPNVTSTNQLNNVTLFFGTNASQLGQVGSSKTYSGSNLTYTLGSSLVIPAGVDSWLEVHGDLQDNSNNNLTSGTVTVSLPFSGSQSSFQVQGMSSQVTTQSTILPGSDLTTTGLTIQTGALNVGKSSYANQTLNPSTSGQKIGEFTLQNQSSSESVRVTNLQVKLYGDATLTNLASGTLLTNISNLHTDETSGSGSQSISPATTNNFSVNFTLAPGASKTIGVYADLSTLSNGTVVVTMLPTAYGVSSNVTLTPSSATQGQTVTLSAGTFNAPTFTTAQSSSSQFVPAAGGAADATHNVFNFTATNGVATISELKFAATGTVGTIASVKLMVNGQQVGQSASVFTPPTTTLTTGTTSAATTLTLGSTANIAVGALLSIASTTATTEVVLVTAVPSATTVTVTRAQGGTTAIAHSAAEVVTINGLADITLSTPISVPNGGAGVYIDAMPTYSSVGSGGLSSNATSTLLVTYEKHTIGGTTTGQAITPVAANSMVSVGSAPTLAVTSTSNNGLVSGENHVFDVTITPSSKGPIQVNTLVFTVSTSTSGTMNLGTTRLAIGSTTITGSSCSGVTTVTCTLPSGYVINAPTTFSLFDTVTGSFGTAGASNLTVVLAAASNFSWTDTAGSGSVEVGAANTSYLYNYPTQTWSVHN